MYKYIRFCCNNIHLLLFLFCVVFFSFSYLKYKIEKKKKYKQHTMFGGISFTRFVSIEMFCFFFWFFFRFKTRHTNNNNNNLTRKFLILFCTVYIEPHLMNLSLSKCKFMILDELSWAELWIGLWTVFILFRFCFFLFCALQRSALCRHFGCE